jgi:sortase A
VTERIPVVNRRRGTAAWLRRATYYGFLASGVFALAYCGYVLAESFSYQSIQRSRFESASTIHTTESRGALTEGSAIGRMKIRRLGLDAIFVQGDSPRILRHAIGHISSTTLPGESGNVVLTGHRDTFFRSLRGVRQGDTIEIKTLDGEFFYKVDWTETVSPNDVEVLQPSKVNTLTLVTCFPFYYVGPAPTRFIVRAHQTNTLPVATSAQDNSAFGASDTAR